MKTLKALAAVVLIGMSAAASAQGYYQGYRYGYHPPVNVYNYNNVYRAPVPAPVYNAPSYRYEHLYGAAIVGAVTGVILENATRPQQPVIVQPAPVVVAPASVPAREPVIVTREEWVYDTTCDCKRRQVTRSVY